MICDTKRIVQKCATGAGLVVIGLAGCSSEPIPSGGSSSATQDNTETSSQSQPLFVGSTKTWPDPVIPVCWEAAPSPDDRGIVRDAIRKTWEMESNVTFTGWGLCPAGATTGLRIRMWSSGAINVGAYGKDLAGMVNGIYLPSWSTGTCYPGWTRERCVRASAVRAFGFGLGFYPEQNREQLGCPALTTTALGNSHVGPFDFQSVMSDCAPKFANDAMLTATDIQGLHQFYGGHHTVAAVSWTPGCLDVFVRGMDGAIWQNSSRFAPFTGFASLANPIGISSPPSVVSWGGDRLDVFGRGVDGSLQHRAWMPGWTAWESLGGKIMGTPKAVSRGSGLLDVFVRGTDRSIRRMTFNGTSWLPWEHVAAGEDVTGDIEAVARGTNRIDIFYRSTVTANTVHRFWNGSTWSGATQLGLFEAVPQAVSGTSDRIDLLVRRQTREFAHASLTGTTWTPFTNLLVEMTTHPTIVARGTTKELFGRGIDGLLYAIRLTGNTWNGWTPIAGAPLRGAPTAVGMSPIRLDLFIKSNQDSLVQNWLDVPPDTWRPTTFPLGGTFK